MPRSNGLNKEESTENVSTDNSPTDQTKPVEESVKAKPTRTRQTRSTGTAAKPATTATRARRTRSTKVTEESPNPQSASMVSKVSPMLMRYREQVKSPLNEEFSYKNVMEIPSVKKVTLNIGLGETKQNAKAMESSIRDISIITGQKPITTRAKKSIAGFKLREGEPIGVAVTLRGKRMYDFLDRLFNTALPRIRDFRGVSRKAFDGNGNYSLGLREQIMFPEIEYDKIDRIRGMQISIVTSAKTDQEGMRLLELMGLPFSRIENS